MYCAEHACVRTIWVTGPGGNGGRNAKTKRPRPLVRECNMEWEWGWNEICEMEMGISVGMMGMLRTRVSITN